MERHRIEGEMRAAAGIPLSVFDRIPDELLGAEWDLFRRTWLGATLIPLRYKHLTALAAAAVLGSRPWTLFHAGMAKAGGATESEIEETARSARLVAGWSAYSNTLEMDTHRFASDVCEMISHLGKIGLGNDL